jgi:hypothetical protein
LLTAAIGRMCCSGVETKRHESETMMCEVISQSVAPSQRRKVTMWRPGLGVAKSRAPSFVVIGLRSIVVITSPAWNGDVGETALTAGSVPKK